jgi:AcrR family transcriptional regulator
MTLPNRTPPYHHGDLRQCFIDAACARLRASSADQLSLRALAREIGVSQTAPYRHFENKNALFAAIATHGFELMTADLQAAAALHNDDIAQTVADVGFEYVQWALRNPEKYQLFFDSSLLDFSDYPALQAAGANCFEVLIGLIRAGIEQQVFVDDSAELLAGTIWASVHGLTSLLQVNIREASTQQNSETVSKAIQALVEQQHSVLRMFVKGIRRPS